MADPARAMIGLVVLPGMDGTGQMLRPFLDAADRHSIPASAISYPVEEVLGYPELEALVRAALPKVDDFVLAAESFSGPIGISIAADPPPNMVGLVLSATFSRNPVAWVNPLAPVVRWMPPHALPERLLSWWLLGKWTSPQLRSSLKDSLRRVSADVLRSRALHAMAVDVSARLQAISMKTLILQASEDRLLGPTASLDLLRGISQASLAVVAGPHLLLQTEPTECAKLVGRFIDACGLETAGHDRKENKTSQKGRCP